MLAIFFINHGSIRLHRAFSLSSQRIRRGGHSHCVPRLLPPDLKIATAGISAKESAQILYPASLRDDLSKFMHNMN